MFDFVVYFNTIDIFGAKSLPFIIIILLLILFFGSIIIYLIVFLLIKLNNKKNKNKNDNHDIKKDYDIITIKKNKVEKKNG